MDVTYGLEGNFASANDSRLAVGLADSKFSGENVAEERNGMLMPRYSLAGRQFRDEGGDFRRAVARIFDGLADRIGRCAVKKVHPTTLAQRRVMAKQAMKKIERVAPGNDF